MCEDTKCFRPRAIALIGFILGTALSTPVRAHNSNRSVQDGGDVSIKAKNSMQLKQGQRLLMWGLDRKEDHRP